MCKRSMLYLAGKGQYVSFALPDLPQYTFTGWVKKYSDSYDERQIFNTAYDKAGVTLYDNNSFLFFDGDYFTTFSPIESNTFYHIAVTNDGATKRIYLNGIEENNGQASTGIESGPAAFGSDAYGNFRFFNGLFDEFKLFNKALSAENIKSLYRDEKPN